MCYSKQESCEAGRGGEASTKEEGKEGQERTKEASASILCLPTEQETTVEAGYARGKQHRTHQGKYRDTPDGTFLYTLIAITECIN